MDIEGLSKTLDRHPRCIAQAAVNLLKKRLIQPSAGTADEAIANLVSQYRLPVPVKSDDLRPRR